MKSGQDIPVTGWAVLGLLSFGRELSGYDLKKWADASMGFFYWSPSFSQIYGELRRLELAGYADARLLAGETGTRGKRLYRITDAGTTALRAWARDAPVQTVVLKHGPMLHLWLGHLHEPEQLRELLLRHRAEAERRRALAEADAQAAADHDDWAYSVLALRWAQRHYAAECALVDEALADLDRLPRSQGQ